MKIKKNIKIIALIYIGVALFTYALTLRINQLESHEDQIIEKSRLAFRIK